jgi:hypothetical protein
MAGPTSKDLIEFDDQGRAVYFSRETGTPSYQPRGYYPQGQGPSLLQNMPTPPAYTQQLVLEPTGKPMATPASTSAMSDQELDQLFPEKKGPLAPTAQTGQAPASLDQEFPEKSLMQKLVEMREARDPKTGNPIDYRWPWVPRPNPSQTLPLALGPAAGPLGAATRIGASGLGGYMETGTARGAAIPAATTAAIEGAVPTLGALMRMLPGIRNLLPMRPGVSNTQRDWSHSPWAGTSQPLPPPPAPTPSPILNPAGQPARMLPPQPHPQPTHVGPVHMRETTTSIPARPYMPNLPLPLRVLLEAAANYGRGQQRDEP